ncbi:MAG TPA: nucleotide exchange factor GrpE [Nostocaceae cyanobacterium]|nr:nucleotide exchange factor GrpE [Nostocaceae cyanobacterium]
MNNNLPTTETGFNLTAKQRDLLLEQLGKLLKDQISLEQSIQEERGKAIASSEELFLELLEVVDALEFLLNYLQENPDFTPELIKRLPKSVGSIHKKLLQVLKKRQVQVVEITNNQPDFNICRVVDCEIRPDLEEQTITKVVRQGFRVGERLLRPAEVITAKKE